MKLHTFYNRANQSKAVANRSGEYTSLQLKPNRTGLPDQLKSGIEKLSGYSMDDVNVHYNSSKPAELQAHAFAQGNQIHLAPGQQKHLPHEAWHVAQQKQGRVAPTTQMKSSITVNDDPTLEREADVMGVKAAQNAKISSNESDGFQTQLKARSISKFGSGQRGGVIQRVTVESFIDWLEQTKDGFMGDQVGGYTVRPEDLDRILSNLKAYITDKEDRFGRAAEMRDFLKGKENSIETLITVAKKEDVGAKGYGASLGDLRIWSQQHTQATKPDPDLLSNLNAVRAFLSNEGEIEKYIVELDHRIGQRVSNPLQPSVTALQGYNLVAREIEDTSGYGKVGEIGVEVSLLDGAKAVMRHARSAQTFIDYGVLPNHGAESHRIQQLILNMAYRKGALVLRGMRPVEVYQALGRADLAVFQKRIEYHNHSIKRKENAGNRKKLYAWELVLDRFDAKEGVFLIDENTGRDVTGGRFDAGIPTALQRHMTRTEGDRRGAPFVHKHLGAALAESAAVQTERKRQVDLRRWRMSMLKRWVPILLGLILTYLNRQKIYNIIKLFWKRLK